MFESIVASLVAKHSEEILSLFGSIMTIILVILGFVFPPFGLFLIALFLAAVTIRYILPWLIMKFIPWVAVKIWRGLVYLYKYNQGTLNKE